VWLMSAPVVQGFAKFCKDFFKQLPRRVSGELATLRTAAPGNVGQPGTSRRSAWAGSYEYDVSPLDSSDNSCLAAALNEASRSTACG
jgi:hypothetical protein